MGTTHVVLMRVNGWPVPPKRGSESGLKGVGSRPSARVVPQDDTFWVPLLKWCEHVVCCCDPVIRGNAPLRITRTTHVVL
jgi:hypothetical protein